MDKSVHPLRRQQRGFSLLEILAALAIGMIMMVSLTAMVDTTLQDTKGQQTAQYQAQFTAAALRYLNDKAAELKTLVLAGSTVPIDLAKLQLDKYLPATFAAENAYRQTPCMLVRASTTPGQLDALVVTEGGDEIPPKDIGYVAANAGTGGGSIRNDIPGNATTPVIAKGAFGAWQLDQFNLTQFISTKCPTASAGASVGRMASLLPYGGPNAVNRDVLFRNLTPSDPKLNQMNVPLGFTAAAMRTVGSSPCTPSAITLETGTGDILKCNTTTTQWENSAARFWKDPVADYAALATISPPPQNGEVHMTLDYGRAYMFKSGVWLPLALDQNGDFNMTNPGNIKVANGSITVSKGNVDIPLGTLTAKNVTATQNVTGNVVYAKSAVVAQSLSPTVIHFTAGDGCNYPGFDSNNLPVTYLSYGTIVSDVNGLIMECKFPTKPTDPPVPSIPSDSQGVFIYVDGSSTTPP